MILISLLLVGVTFSLSAQNSPAKATPKVTKQQKNQQKRIVEGAASGELTKAEVKELERQQRAINRNKRKAKADGVVTRRERAKLNRQQKNASGNIYRKKHNKKDRN